jgi:hypothetical protein
MRPRAGRIATRMRIPNGTPSSISPPHWRTPISGRSWSTKRILRAEWWKTLTLVAENLKDPTIIALTATPPYDVSAFEWQRYSELCGPVGAEVSVPELVLQGDLCPHQDYVYFSTPVGRDQQALSDFRAAIDSFVQRLRSTEEFKTALRVHPWILHPDGYVESILDNPQYLSSMIIYLKATGEEISKDLLKLLGLPNKRIPALDLEWLEILLSNCLYTDVKNFRPHESLFKALRRELLAIGAIEHRKVKLRSPSDQARLLTTSVTKLKSIEDIVRLESQAMGNALRCVVLTDFIRQSELPSHAGETGSFEDIGVAPIFETLRRAGLQGIRLGVLSGSMVLIPAPAEPLLRAAASTLGVRHQDLSMVPLRYDSRYLMVELRGEYFQGSVRLITSVFERGGITVLVGTKSLLGEGWDAPCINTLVLASSVGSFVLSNQMRGRSIRVEANNPDKTANIWHLVCLEPGPSGPGGDFVLLARRCRAFVGVGPAGAGITSGTERLGIGDPPFTLKQIADINADTRRRALDRSGLQQRWRNALHTTSMQRMAAGLRAPKEILPRGFLLANTVTSLLFQSGSTFLAFLLQGLRDPTGVRSGQDLLAFGVTVAGFSAAVSLPWAARAAWRLMRHGTPERSIRQIGQVVLESLIYEGSVHRNQPGVGKRRALAGKNTDGTVFCWIDGRGHEQAAFLRALSEVLGPIENARFLIARQRTWWGLREDYFGVPEVLAKKKEFAEFFAQKWRSAVGPAALVYTRTPEGRRVLLRARLHSLASNAQERPEPVSCWK